MVNILLVDDEDDTKFLFNSFFRKDIRNDKYRFLFVNNGKDAFELYQRENFDILLTDLNMPIMSGVELIRKIKEIKANQCIVILTAYDSEQHREFSESYDNITFFPKPVDFEKLREVLAKLSENFSPA